MKRTLLTIAALLFSTGLASAGGTLVEPFSWTGFYVGAHTGAAWSSLEVRDTTGGVPAGPFKFSDTAFFGGATAGYNFQRDRFVIGIEADLGYMDQLATGRIASSNPIYHQNVEVAGGLYGDVTARAGIVIERTLIYGKGGWAFLDGEGSQTTTKPGYRTTGTDMFTGWVAGAGVEHSLSPNLSLKVEYLHFDFGSQGAMQTSITDPPIGFKYLNKFDLTADTVKVGLNYKF